LSRDVHFIDSPDRHREAAVHRVVRRRSPALCGRGAPCVHATPAAARASMDS
jgi:hypothetical protein